VGNQRDVLRRLKFRGENPTRVCHRGLWGGGAYRVVLGPGALPLARFFTVFYHPPVTHRRTCHGWEQHFYFRLLLFFTHIVAEIGTYNIITALFLFSQLDTRWDPFDIRPHCVSTFIRRSLFRHIIIIFSFFFPCTSDVIVYTCLRGEYDINHWNRRSTGARIRAFLLRHRHHYNAGNIIIVIVTFAFAAHTRIVRAHRLFFMREKSVKMYLVFPNKTLSIKTSWIIEICIGYLENIKPKSGTHHFWFVTSN